MRFRPLFSVLLFTLTLAMPLFAHDTWLAPDRFGTSQPGGVTLSLSSGMEFPKLDYPIAADRVAAATWRSAGTRGDLPSGTSTAHALEWQANAGDGVTVFSVVLKPRPSKLKPDQVQEYLDHLGIPKAEDVLAKWKRTSKGEETGYRYMKYAKTFVRRGNASESRVWAEAAGMRLELVPQDDPTSMTTGGTLDVLVLENGKPLPRYPLSLIGEGVKDPVRTVTDTQGRARIALPAAGVYMLKATTLEPSMEKASSWDVHFTTMTFEVAPVR